MSTLTLTELRELARQNYIAGYSILSRQALIDQLIALHILPIEEYDYLDSTGNSSPRYIVTSGPYLLRPLLPPRQLPRMTSDTGRYS